METLPRTFPASLLVLALAPTSHAATPTEPSQHGFERVIGGAEATLTEAFEGEGEMSFIDLGAEKKYAIPGLWVAITLFE